MTFGSNLEIYGKTKLQFEGESVCEVWGGALFPVKTQTRIWAHMEEVINALTLHRLKFGTITDCEMGSKAMH